MKRSTQAIKAGLAVAIVATLGACGGSNGDGAPTLRTLSGKIAGDGSKTWKVCLDSNQSLSCDADEVSTLADAGASYSLDVPTETSLAGRYWVAEQISSASSAGAATVSLRLSAPSSSTVISSLSTLVTAQWLEEPAAGLHGAQQRIRSVFGFAEGVDLLALHDPEAHPGVAAVADAALVALEAATQQRAQRLLLNARPGARPTTALSATAGGQPVERVALNVLGRYVDTTKGRMLATVTLRTIVGEIKEIYNPTQCRIEAPLRVFIDTENGVAVDSKETYVKARLRTEASAVYGDAIDVATSIRGRGNSTWNMPKKPYRLKLDKAAALLGMNPDKDWALLANYADKTLLRNALAMCIGQTLGMRYTPAYRFIELELNGQYAGVYQLMEHIKTAEHRVDIGSASAPAGDPGGFLLEIDTRLDAEHWFLSARQAIPFTFKSDPSAAQIPLVEQLIAKLEDALFADNFASHPTGGYLSQLDTEALVDFYLINEFLRTNDVFWSSTFVTRKNDGPLVFGPLWDFDIAAGNINYNSNDAAEGWWVRSATSSIHNSYILRLLEDPAFAKHVAARWQFLSRSQPAIQRFIGDSAATLDAAQKRNFQTWDILGSYVWPNAVVTGSYGGEVDYLSTWLKRRAAWIDRELLAPSERR